ncbi:hypothetical protein MRX96_050193 [Rhipicephalus microplus]
MCWYKTGFGSQKMKRKKNTEQMFDVWLDIMTLQAWTKTDDVTEMARNSTPGTEGRFGANTWNIPPPKYACSLFCYASSFLQITPRSRGCFTGSRSSKPDEGGV